MLEVVNKTKSKFTRREFLSFERISRRALGRGYEVSLVICGDKLSHKHNVLAYPLSRNSGEIFLNPSRRGHHTLVQLFAHACAHLAGFDHSPEMEKFEQKLMWAGGL